MTNIKTLFKYNFIKLINIFRGKNQKKSTKVGLFLLILCAVGITALYTVQAWSMFFGLAPLGLSRVVLFHGCMVALFVLTILSTMRVAGAKKSHDEDLLLSLPIRKSEIILSKISGKYFFDLTFCAVLVLPFSILYQIFVSFSIVTTLLSFLLIFLLPLFSVGLTYIFSFIVNNVFSKSRYAKVIKTLTSVLIMVAVMVLLILKTTGYGAVDPTSLELYFADRPVSSQLLYFVLGEGFMPAVWVVLLSVIPFVLGILLFTKNLGRDEVGYRVKSKVLVFNSPKNFFSLLLKKEFATYFSSPAYVTNTILGPIGVVILSIVFCIFGNEIILTLGISQMEIAGIVLIIFCLLSSMTLISCCSISLEGKNFWIIKTTPINKKAFVFSKVFVNFIILGITLLISCLILVVFSILSPLEVCFVFLSSIVYAFTFSGLGVVINLFFPKMEFTDETQVVKQSMATLLAMLGGFLLSLIPLGIYYVFKNLLAVEFIFMIVILLYLAISLILSIFLYKNCEKLINNIE